MIRTLYSDRLFPPLEQALIEQWSAGCGRRSAVTGTPDLRLPPGIFHWFNPGEIILWWSPDPRMVLFPRELKNFTFTAKP
ncbi:MAG: hypothetical protein P0107_01870 [Nitrosomonas sp.]|nr:hypothetical protein [Nitrosomonas sp.]